MAGSGPIVGKAYVTIIPTTKNARREISKALIPEMEGAGKDGGEAMSGGLRGAISSGAGKIASLAKGILGSTAVQAMRDFQSNVLDTYSTFEQLSGGVEKIFDEMDTATIMNDAKEAYKTLGVSANEYLESMTSIGATFASTLGDQKGYDVAKQGLQAISDYASGTGRDMGLLTEKYQLITRSTTSYLSIADQFAGLLPQTNEGFLEAAQAAGLLSDQYTQLKDVPLPEYQEAVTAMLTKGVDAMGLLGNTAAEAENTLQGSTNMMKASWENLLTAFGTGTEEEITNAFGDALDATGTWARNMYDRINTFRQGLMQALPGMWNEIVARIPAALDYVKDVIRDKLSHWHEVAQGIIDQVAPFVQRLGVLAGEAIRTILPKIGPVLMSALDVVLTTIRSIDWAGLGLSILEAIMSIDWLGLAGKIIDTVMSLATSIATRIVEVAGNVDWSAIGEAVVGAITSVDWLGVAQSIVDTVVSTAGDLLDALLGTRLGQGILDAFDAVKGFIEETLGKAGAAAKDNLGEVLTSIGDVITNIGPTLQDLAAKFMEFIGSIDWQAVLGFLQQVWGSVSSIASSIGAVLIDVVGGVLWPLLENLWGFISETLMPGLMQFIEPLGVAITTVLDVLAAVWDWLSQIIGAITDVLSPAIDILFAFLSPLLGGLIDALATIFSTVVDTLAGLWEKIKPFVDTVIGIVSTIFSTIGGWLEDNKGWISDLVGWLGSTLGSFFGIVADTIGTIFSVLGDLLGGVIGTVTGVIGGIWGAITGFIDMVRGAFDLIVGIITGNFDQAKEGAVSILNGLISVIQGVADAITAPFKEAFELLKKLWNNSIGSLEFTIPDWIPGIGGQTWGLPKLAEGGTLTSGGTVLVGELGPELLTLPRGATVKPLDAASTEASGGDSYVVEVGDVLLSDDEQVKRATREYLEYLATRANRRRVPTAVV